jgi:Putative lumazine-binding
MATDQELITQSVQDYFEGWYHTDVARMDRALQPDLVKRSPAEDGGAILTKELMLQPCAEGEGEGARIADRWMKIDIAYVCGGIASAVVRSAPYRKYLRLIETGDRWKIADALWLRQ